MGWPKNIAEGTAPVPFEPGMTTPLATLDGTAAWRRQAAAASA